MRHIEFYGDKRQVAACVFCGAGTETRDHVPSRVFLDEPYPEHLPRVPACEECNQGFSLDEEYVACLVECVICGTTKVEEIHREKIRHALSRKPALLARMEQSRRLGPDGNSLFIPEEARVQRVALKLARGHALFELNETHREEPVAVGIRPLLTMTPQERAAFETAPSQGPSIWPEAGSRAMVRIIQGDIGPSGWIEVQAGRYRYLADVGNGVTIRFVISEYLAGEIVWE